MFRYTAFDGFDLLARGTLEEVALAAKKNLKSNKNATILIFSDQSGQQMDLDLSGSNQDVLERLKVYIPVALPPRLGAGRPKLGVVPREISLLPSHWEWLANQPGGASNAIRSLIDDKMNVALHSRNQVKQAQEATYKFLSALAGNLPNFEEVIRYLYRKDKAKFELNMKGWSKDVRNHASKLADCVFRSGS